MRNKVRKAQKVVTITTDRSIEDFYRLNKKVFERQGIKAPYSFNFLKRLDNALKTHNSRQVFFAIDDAGRIHSAIYLIWDSFSSYLHIVGEDPFFRNSGAGILLIWETIKYAKEVLGLNRYDFEGSMIEPVEKVRRACGGQQKPYLQVKKTSSFLLKLRHQLF